MSFNKVNHYLFRKEVVEKLSQKECSIEEAFLYLRIDRLFRYYCENDPLFRLDYSEYSLKKAASMYPSDVIYDASKRLPKKVDEETRQEFLQAISDCTAYIIRSKTVDVDREVCQLMVALSLLSR